MLYPKFKIIINIINDVIYFTLFTCSNILIESSPEPVIILSDSSTSIE